MVRNYMLNEDTGVLHIVGFCCHTSGVKPNHVKFFNTEDDAYSYAGRRVIPCDLCQQEKEKKLKEKTRG